MLALELLVSTTQAPLKAPYEPTGAAAEQAEAHICVQEHHQAWSPCSFSWTQPQAGARPSARPRRAPASRAPATPPAASWSACPQSGSCAPPRCHPAPHSTSGVPLKVEHTRRQHHITRTMHLWYAACVQRNSLGTSSGRCARALGCAPAQAGQEGLDAVQQVVVRQRLLRLALAHDPVPELHIAGAEVLAALRDMLRVVLRAHA